MTDNNSSKLENGVEKLFISLVDTISSLEMIKRDKSFYNVLKQLCESKGIQVNEDVEEEVNKEIKRISDIVNDYHKININITKDNYEALIQEAFKHNEKIKEQQYLLDILLNVDFKDLSNTFALTLKNSLVDYVTSDSKQDVNNLVSVLTDELSKEAEDIFGPSTIDKEWCSNIMHKLYYNIKLSEVLEIRNKYREQYHITKNNNMTEIYKEEYPEFYQELVELTKLSDIYDLYYHGTVATRDSEKICNEGLFMQYNEIERTATKGLNPTEIIKYTYGHEGAGRRSIVVIATPKGIDPTTKNEDESIIITGTGQGLEGSNSFNPKYMIPKEYIYGIIDKGNKVITKNPYFKVEIQAK